MTGSEKLFQMQSSLQIIAQLNDQHLQAHRATFSPDYTSTLSLFFLHFLYKLSLYLHTFTLFLNFRFCFYTFTFVLHFYFCSTFSLLYYIFTLFLHFHFLSTLSFYFYIFTFFIHYYFLCTTVHFPIGQFPPRSCVRWQFLISLDFPFLASNKNWCISGLRCNYCHGI